MWHEIHKWQNTFELVFHIFWIEIYAKNTTFNAYGNHIFSKSICHIISMRFVFRWCCTAKLVASKKYWRDALQFITISHINNKFILFVVFLHTLYFFLLSFVFSNVQIKEYWMSSSKIQSIEHTRSSKWNCLLCINRSVIVLSNEKKVY